MDMPEIEIAGINVRNADLEYLAYMLRYDTTFGRFPKSLEVYDKGLVIDGKKVPVYSFSEAINIPWKECGAEYIVEAVSYTHLDVYKRQDQKLQDNRWKRRSMV